MLWGGHNGGLEVRTLAGGETRLSGHFPYSVETELSPGRAEIIEARAFSSRISSGGEIHFLFGHSYEKPLASRSAGSLELKETGSALEFEATINPSTSWASDFLAAHEAGLIRGLSPGFSVPKGGERVERRGRGLLRSITAAELFEISAVVKPAYGQAQIEARSWAESCNRQPDHALCKTLARWRA